MATDTSSVQPLSKMTFSINFIAIVKLQQLLNPADMNPFCAASEEFIAAEYRAVKSLASELTRYSPVKSGFLQTPENLRAGLSRSLLPFNIQTVWKLKKLYGF